MFTVHWVRAALNDLAAIWLDADSDERERITQATHEIDQRLGREPEEAGESREAGRRIFLVAPLAVKYRVNSSSSTVRILHVWRFRTGTDSAA